LTEKKGKAPQRKKQPELAEGGEVPSKVKKAGRAGEKKKASRPVLGRKGNARKKERVTSLIKTKIHVSAKRGRASPDLVRPSRRSSASIVTAGMRYGGGNEKHRGQRKKRRPPTAPRERSDGPRKEGAGNSLGGL